jgi:transcriptional regulator with GAF, ATPase, and Fis domain
MRRLFALVERVAASDSNVLIEGESGTGKELVASEIVRAGNRAKKPFVIVDCSAISPNLIESELFGHTRGAFTGADRDRIGAFEAAQGGTVFLDEIGEMPLEMQPKLLRALEAREIRRIGEASTRKVDVRVIAATNRRLEREVNQGRFREDLYFRLSVVTLRVPPLRERLEDLPLLVRNFLEVLGANESAHLFTRDVLDDLGRHEWPGNVRELRNFVERTVVLQTTSPTYSDSPFGNRSPSQPPRAESAGPQPVDLAVSFREAKERTIADFERRYIGSLLDWSDGNISRAARKAQMDRMNLYRLIQRYGLRDTRVLDRDDKE